MQRYNLILTTIHDPVGLRIMPSEVYISSIVANPGWNHENRGDFYSEIEPKNLAEVVRKALEHKHDDGKVIPAFVLYASEFDPEKVDMGEENCTPRYVVQYKDGSIGLHLPVVERGNKDYKNFGYSNFGFSVLSKLITNKNGSMMNPSTSVKKE